MSVAHQIIQEVHKSGCELWPLQGKLKILEGERLNPHLINKVRAHKADILELFKYDEQVKQLGMIVAISGELYTWTVSPFSTAYMERTDNEWTAWRESYQRGTKTATHVKIIAEKDNFQNVLGRTAKYINFIEEKRGI
ncbi:hypothetical protein GCM10010954_23900 [Halobacillus andaensis]|uniref:Uncharacterized protein n=1 Tax=Halobacillus andaensis TaxID=1176239 RepID=A0A917B5R3_HALAA|nr:hypothetical protein [Halobacillus andaensis]MBP2006020.1 hypothetical protein [Halobacillus andaensis]GGF24243.1 hypothetical protein GCM10010954_23900 [Halobacillus andaensis]